MSGINMTTLDIHDPRYDPELDRRNRFKFNPNETAAICFLASFAVLTVLHIILTINSRIWWLFATAVGGIGEVIGWYGRLAGSHDPRRLTPYLIQQVCLAISPVFYSGVCYGLFTKLVFIIDPSLSRIPPRYLTPMFITFDIICLVIQAIGGGRSAVAAAATDPGAGARAETGGHIYLAGVAVQLAVMIGFGLLGLDYARKVRRSGIADHVWKSAGGKRVKILVGGIVLASFLIIFRNAFRTVELAEGYYGYLAIHEIYFVTLDSLPMALCMMVLLLTHPAFTLSMVTPATFARNQIYAFPNDSSSDRKVRAWRQAHSGSEKGLELSNSRQWSINRGYSGRGRGRDERDEEESV